MLSQVFACRNILILSTMDPGGALYENICNKNASIFRRFAEKGFQDSLKQDLLNGENVC